MSNPNQIRLVSISVESFAGISHQTQARVIYPEAIQDQLQKLDPEQGIYLVMPEEYRVAVAEGDQGLGKTSFIEFMGVVTGNFEEPTNSINTQDQNKKGRMRFYGKDGKFYEARITRSTFVLEEIETDEPYGNPVLDARDKEIKKEVKKPKETLLKLLGPAGFDPLTLKRMSGADQIKWLRQQATLDTETQRLELEVKDRINKSYKERTKAGQMQKHYKALVDASPYYKNWQEFEQKFSSTEHDNVAEQVAETQRKYTTYTNNENGVALLRDQRTRKQDEVEDCEEEIRELEEKLLRARESLEQKVHERGLLDQRIEKGEQWLQNNAAIKQEFEQATRKIEDAAQFQRDRQQFEQMKENKKQWDHYTSEYVRLTNIIDENTKVKKEITRLFTPKVEGLEVLIPDENDPREGLVYQGKTSDQWAESEAWEVCLGCWQDMGTRIVFVDNLTSLGSGAIEKLNDFVLAGGYILGTQMNRSEKSLKITIANKLPQ
jgi:hypothetical protein